MYKLNNRASKVMKQKSKNQRKKLTNSQLKLGILTPLPQELTNKYTKKTPSNYIENLKQLKLIGNYRMLCQKRA